MSLAEQYSAGAILMLPSRSFLQTLIKNAEDTADVSIAKNKIDSNYWASHLQQGVFSRGCDDPSATLVNLPRCFRELVAAYPHSVTVTPTMHYYAFQTPSRELPQPLESTREVDWWLDRADFYDSRWFPGIKYFDSWEDLLVLIKQEMDVDEHRLHLDSLRRRTDEVPFPCRVHR